MSHLDGKPPAIISVEMRVPGPHQRVFVNIRPDLGVAIIRRDGEEVLAEGLWNLCGVTWFMERPEREAFSAVALDMIEARVAAVVDLFRHGWLNPKWGTDRAQHELRSF